MLRFLINDNIFFLFLILLMIFCNILAHDDFIYDENGINGKRSKICTFLLIGAEFDVSSCGISS